jgi:hypothetical protein
MITLRPTRQLYCVLHTGENLGSSDGAASHRVKEPPEGTSRKRMLPPRLQPRRSFIVSAAIRRKTPTSAATVPRVRTS